MKIIVGLGNPGPKYVGTRHNVGFEVLARFARKHLAGPVKNKFQGEIAEADVGNEKVLLLSPLTYMNLSGASVLAARDFYKVDLSDILVICDDFNLPLAKLRMRASGSAGGQKGLDDILRRLGSQAVPRLRLGIGVPPPQWDVANYVLSKFTKDEQPLVEEAYARAVEATGDWVTRGITECMNKYNA
jgi:peptidyl-tRNA hydrolase, PTH1 family